MRGVRKLDGGGQVIEPIEGGSAGFWVNATNEKVDSVGVLIF